jgi:hypothetical protein
MMHRWSGWGLALLLGSSLFFWYLLTFPGSIGPRISDGRSMYLVTAALVDRHDVALYDPFEPQLLHGWQPPPATWRTGLCPTEPAVIGVGTRVGGPVFAKYGIGQSLAAVPLYVAGQHLASLVQPSFRPEVPPFVTSAYNSLITALTGMLLCLWALRLGFSRRTALALVLLFGLATPAWAYTTTFFSEPSITLCLLGTVAALYWSGPCPSWRGTLLAGTWLGAAILVRLDSAAYLPLFGLAVLLKREEAARVALRPGWLRLLIALGAVPVLALLIIAVYNQARFGNPLSTGYGIAGDYHDLHPPHTLQGLWEGIYGPLFSPGKGLFLYAPILLLLPWGIVRLIRTGRAHLAVVILAVAAIGVLTHANTLIVWLGGWAWGPRFLIPLIPLLLIPVGAAIDQASVWLRRAAIALGLLGVVIQIPGVLLDPGVYISYLRDSLPSHCIWQAEDLYKWHPGYSPLIGQWERLLDPATYSTQRLNLHIQLAGVRAQLANPHLTQQQLIAAGRIVPSPLAWWQLLSLQGVAWTALVPPLAILLTLSGVTLVAALRCAAPAPSVSWSPTTRMT